MLNELNPDFFLSEKQVADFSIYKAQALTMKTPIQIYCMAKQDRSDRVRWLLEELGIPYQDHFLNRGEGQLNTESFRKLSPTGRVPVIVDQNTVMYESAAICIYLADQYRIKDSEKSLAPKIDSAERAAYLQWMVFSVASLENVVAKMFTLTGKSEAEANLIKKEVKEQSEILKLALNSVLEKQTYLLPSGFSAADIIMAAVIPGASEYLMTPGSAIARYMAHMMKRPAAIKTEVF